MLGMDIMDKQVRVFDEPLQDLLALGLFQVERDPAFIGVQEKIEPALFLVWLSAWKRTALTGRVSPLRRLNFHDLCAHVGHELAGVGGGDHLAAFNDPKTR